jgi:hypothetical protein
MNLTKPDGTPSSTKGLQARRARCPQTPDRRLAVIWLFIGYLTATGPQITIQPWPTQQACVEMIQRTPDARGMCIRLPPGSSAIGVLNPEGD